VNELELEEDIKSSISKEFYGCEQSFSSFKFITPGEMEKAVLRDPQFKSGKSINSKKMVLTE